MSTPTPNPGDHFDLREALRRDAARMQEPAFDATLHHATMRRISGLSEAGASRSGLRLILALAVGVVLLLVIVMNLTRHEPSRARPDVSAAITSTQNNIARLSVEVPSLFPAWASPTASMLDQPQIPE